MVVEFHFCITLKRMANVYVGGEKTQNAVFVQFGSDAAVNVVLNGSYRFNDYTVMLTVSAGSSKYCICKGGEKGRLRCDFCCT